MAPVDVASNGILDPSTSTPADAGSSPHAPSLPTADEQLVSEPTASSAASAGHAPATSAELAGAPSPSLAALPPPPSELSDSPLIAAAQPLSSRQPSNDDYSQMLAAFAEYDSTHPDMLLGDTPTDAMLAAVPADVTPSAEVAAAAEAAAEAEKEAAAKEAAAAAVAAAAAEKEAAEEEAAAAAAAAAEKHAAEKEAAATAAAAEKEAAEKAAAAAAAEKAAVEKEAAEKEAAAAAAAAAVAAAAEKEAAEKEAADKEAAEKEAAEKEAAAEEAAAATAAQAAETPADDSLAVAQAREVGAAQPGVVEVTAQIVSEGGAIPERAAAAGAAEGGLGGVDAHGEGAPTQMAAGAEAGAEAGAAEASAAEASAAEASGARKKEAKYFAAARRRWSAAEEDNLQRLWDGCEASMGVTERFEAIEAQCKGTPFERSAGAIWQHWSIYMTEGGKLQAKRKGGRVNKPLPDKSAKAAQSSSETVPPAGDDAAATAAATAAVATVDAPSAAEEAPRPPQDGMLMADEDAAGDVGVAGDGGAAYPSAADGTLMVGGRTDPGTSSDAGAVPSAADAPSAGDASLLAVETLCDPFEPPLGAAVPAAASSYSAAGSEDDSFDAGGSWSSRAQGHVGPSVGQSMDAPYETARPDPYAGGVHASYALQLDFDADAAMDDDSLARRARTAIAQHQNNVEALRMRNEALVGALREECTHWVADPHDPLNSTAMGLKWLQAVGVHTAADEQLRRAQGQSAERMRGCLGQYLQYSQLAKRRRLEADAALAALAAQQGAVALAEQAHQDVTDAEREAVGRMRTLNGRLLPSTAARMLPGP